MSNLFFVVVALFLGVNISDVNIHSGGWGIMLGWTVWIFVLPVLIELLEYKFRVEKSNLKLLCTNSLFRI